MQNLTVNEIIGRIEKQECFEATCNNSFQIKIQEYVPYVCGAVHDGHHLREDLIEKCNLSESERYFEEDPFTAEFIQSLPLTIYGLDSRYEYDLNRDQENCIYEEAWGKTVWKTPLHESQKEVSLNKHQDFYLVVDALIKKLKSIFGSLIIYDIHSYNHLRHSVTYPFNLGIENIDIKKYNAVISNWKRELKGMKVKKAEIDVSVNHVFKGRGYFLKHITDTFSDVLVLATEVKKFYINEETGQEFPIIIQSLAKELKTAILKNSEFFISEHKMKKRKKKVSLLTTHIPKSLLNLDKQLFKQLKNFELLNYVNPVNTESEKKKFFSHKCNYNPIFRYKPLTIDPHIFKSQLYQLPVDDIEDVHIRQVYIDIISAYSDKVDMLSSLGTEKFLYNSLRYFGKPSEKDIANAQFLLYCKDLDELTDDEYLPTSEVIEKFKQEAHNYGFDFQVKLVNNIASDAMVINSTSTVLIKKGAQFTKQRLNALISHEIGIHMVTTKNAQLQPLRFLSLGLPKNTYTQEGLALMSELNTGGLTILRLKEIALRVLAIESLVAGNDFKTTYSLLDQEKILTPDRLFYLVTRVYRGGGFTKDYLYLRGLRSILNLMNEKSEMKNLFLGKTNHHYLPIINEMVDRGFLTPPKFECHGFFDPKPIHPIISYLTESIK